MQLRQVADVDDDPRRAAARHTVHFHRGLHTFGGFTELVTGWRTQHHAGVGDVDGGAAVLEAARVGLYGRLRPAVAVAAAHDRQISMEDVEIRAEQRREARDMNDGVDACVRGTAEDVAGSLEVGVQHLVGTIRISGHHCRAMDDGVASIERGTGRLAVGDVADHVVTDVCADLGGAGREAVRVADQESDLVSGFLGRLRRPRADETCAAGNQYLHVPSARRRDAGYPQRAVSTPRSEVS